MIAVIFEAWIEAGYQEEYLSLAAGLRSRLDEIDGFISIERFESLHEPGKVLSLSLWRDEKAVEDWRQMEVHRLVQARGREAIFKDYRLRVAAVLRDYGMMEREEAPLDSQLTLDVKRQSGHGPG